MEYSNSNGSAWYKVMDMIDLMCETLMFNNDNSERDVNEFRYWAVAHTDFEEEDEESAAIVSKLVIAEAAKRFC